MERVGKQKRKQMSMQTIMKISETKIENSNKKNKAMHIATTAVLETERETMVHSVYGNCPVQTVDYDKVS